MSIAATGGLIGSAAGAPVATRNSETQTAAQETAKQDRQVQAELRSETAAGIGATDGEDQQASERDADGRRLWEAPLPKKSPVPSTEDAANTERHSKDASGQSGNTLDLSG